MREEEYHDHHAIYLGRKIDKLNGLKSSLVKKGINMKQVGAELCQTQSKFSSFR